MAPIYIHFINPLITQANLIVIVVYIVQEFNVYT